MSPFLASAKRCSRVKPPLLLSGKPSQAFDHRLPVCADSALALISRDSPMKVEFFHFSDELIKFYDTGARMPTGRSELLAPDAVSSDEFQAPPKCR